MTAREMIQHKIDIYDTWLKTEQFTTPEDAVCIQELKNMWERELGLLSLPETSIYIQEEHTYKENKPKAIEVVF